MKKPRAHIHRNFQRALLVLLALIFIITCRYAWLQIVQGEKLANRMRHQVGGEYAIQSVRGPILDRNERELAISTMTKSLFVDPHNVKDPEGLAKDLAPLVGLTEQDILDKIAQGGGFVWVKRRMERDEYEAIRKMRLDKDYISCLGFRDEAKRYYPNDSLAAHVIGFVGVDDKGLDGVEQAFDSYLKGDITEEFLYTDNRDRPILDSIFARRHYDGDRCKTVELTLDSVVQFIVEQELDRTVAETSPKSITCIVMDPKTGEILALASRPTYNPNRFDKYSPETWKNRAVSFIYEPGSTFKSIVAGAALQEHVVTPDQVFVDPGHITVSGHTIQNWNGESFGTVTFTEVVKQSLNTGFGLVGLDLGAEKMMKYAKLFGFGERTNIHLPGEEAGILFDAEDMVKSDIATTAIGQSIAVTPLQLVTAMSAIANDGILLKPHITKSIKNADGSPFLTVEPEPVQRALESATNKTLVGLLEQVVSSGGGTKARVKGYRLAGKTGTAQKINLTEGGYMEGHYIASFCGFGPVEDPRLTVLVIIDDPSGGEFYGGQIAAPVASRIFKQLFRYLRIPPSNASDIDDDEEKTEHPKKRHEAPKKRAPLAPSEIPAGMTAVPDFRGDSLREAAQNAAAANLTFKREGEGYAVAQSINANTIVEPGREITITFRP